MQERGAGERAAAKQLHQTSEGPGRQRDIMHTSCCSSSGTSSTSTRRPAELHPEDSATSRPTYCVHRTRQLPRAAMVCALQSQTSAPPQIISALAQASWHVAAEDATNLARRVGDHPAAAARSCQMDCRARCPVG